MPDPKLTTKAVRAGVPEEKPDFLPSVAPIHPAVTYRYHSMDDLDAVFAGEREGYVYSRYGSPTVTELEEVLASLENGERALAFSSGMAALHTTFLALGARAGSSIVAAQDIYGATHALLEQLLETQGVTTRFVDATDVEAVEKACAVEEPALVVVETLSNPLLKVADIPALAEVAHRHSAYLVVDSTFTTPYLIRPLEIGADVVVHSATKYIGGHGDVLGGVAVTTEALREKLFEITKLSGGNLSPFDAWLLLRGVKTLPVRMRQHCENALGVARWLMGHPRVERVYYPGLESHPQHALAERLFGNRGYGGMVAFDIAGAGQADVFRFFESLELCLSATTLGDVCTLMLYPAHSSHRPLSPKQREAIGIGAGLVRMSVGIEDVDDILSDLEQALNRL